MSHGKTVDYLGLVPMSGTLNGADMADYEDAPSKPAVQKPQGIPPAANGSHAPVPIGPAVGMWQHPVPAKRQVNPERKYQRYEEEEEDDGDQATGVDFPAMAHLGSENKQCSFQLNFLDASAVNSIKNTFAALIDLKHDTTAEIEVLNRKTFYTIKLQKAQLPISVCDLNAKLAALKLCISNVEFVVRDEGGSQLAVDFAKKDNFSALTQLEGSAKRVRNSPLFGTDELAAVGGSKRAKVTKAGRYAISAATDFGAVRQSEDADVLTRIRKAAPHEDYYQLLFDSPTDYDKEGLGVSAFDATLLKRVIEYGMTCCGKDTPDGLRWFFRYVDSDAPAETKVAEDTPALLTAAFRNAAGKQKRVFVIMFRGFERLNLDQLRGFHDLFPHHVTDVLLHVKDGDVSVFCNPYLLPNPKPWVSTLFYRKAA